MIQLEELAKEEVLKRAEDNCEPLRAQLIAAQKELETQDGQLAESQSLQALYLYELSEARQDLALARSAEESQVREAEGETPR